MRKLQIVIATENNHFISYGEAVPIIYCNYITKESLETKESIDRIKVKLKESIDYTWTMILASGIENNGYYITKKNGLSALLNIITDYQFLCSIVKSEIKVILQIVEISNEEWVKERSQ